jgi:protein-tyrosine phosphatase
MSSNNNRQRIPGKTRGKNPLGKSEVWDPYYELPAAASVYQCHHWGQIVEVGSYTVRCSGSTYEGKWQAPDVGVYLDFSWAAITNTDLKSSDVFSVEGNGDYLIAKWKDFGVISLDKLETLVSIVVDELRADSVVEIGCIGGHGRTGTLLAAVLGKIEKLPAKRAVQEVRRRYCDKAVETQGQMDLLDKCLPEVGEDHSNWLQKVLGRR